MRFRTSAAVALVTALLAPAVSLLACGFDCSPADIAVVTTSETPAAEGSCHREADDAVPADFTLSAAPHDCAEHSAAVPHLRNPIAPLALNRACGVDTVPAVAAQMPDGTTGAVWSARKHDLAPPGRTPGLIAPLRI